MNCTYIKQEVCDIIRSISLAFIRIAAMIITIDNIELIDAAACLNVGEEFSSNNIAIIQQLAML